MINREKVMKALSDNNLNIAGVVKFHEGNDLKKNKNKQVQISRLLNREPETKGYFTDIKLAEYFCEMLNKILNKNYTPTYFLMDTNISIIGDNIKGWVRPIDEQSIENFDCGHNFQNHDCILENNGHGKSVIKVFKKKTSIDRDSYFSAVFCNL